MRDYLCALPPKQHPAPNAEPDGASGKIASEQMAKRVEPCDDADVKSDLIERHHEHEEYRYRPHFCILSPTPSVAPAKPRKLAAECLALSGQGCTRQIAATAQRHRLEASFHHDTAASRDIVACETLNVRATAACALPLAISRRWPSRASCLRLYGHELARAQIRLAHQAR